MYCPSCRSEYQQEVTVCAHCQVPLVSDLPDVDPFATADGMAKLLEGKEMTSFAMGYHPSLREMQALLAANQIPSMIGYPPGSEEAGIAVETMCLLLLVEHQEKAHLLLDERWQESVHREGLVGNLPDTMETCPACSASVPFNSAECDDCGLVLGVVDDENID